jgi:ubiquinone/menaquinone biosynthesis C-methylase UbiE
MALSRVLEPEVMDSDDEARDYDAMDHEGVNGRFCEELLALSPDVGATLDVGTGTARIPLELVRRAPAARVVGVDLADAMLKVAAENIARAGAGDRVRVERADAKRLPHADGAFTCVVSNTILHHIPEVAPVVGEMLRVLARGGRLFVRDLVRPVDESSVQRLVALHAAHDTSRQRALFDASLRASLTLDEVRAMVASLGVPPGDVQMTSDRHWTLAHAKS